MKWRARAIFDHMREIQTVLVEAKTAIEAERTFCDWFCSMHQNSDGVMWSDYVLISDWERVEGGENDKI